MIRGIDKENLEAFLIALEGWRRGLRLTWYYDDDIDVDIIDQTQAIGNTFSLSSEHKTHYFFKTLGDKLDKDILKNNQLDLLEKIKNQKIQTVDYTLLSSDVSLEAIKKTVEKIGLPVQIFIESENKDIDVLKIETEKDLNDIQVPNGRTRVLIKKVVDGDNYHIYVVNKKVVAAVKKILMDNGEDKNSNSQNFQDVTDYLPLKLSKLIGDTINNLPELNQFGIEIIVSNDTPIINDVTITDNILKYTFPSKGNPRNVASSIIDNYFPETIGLAEDRTKIYFDYKKINKLLKHKIFYAIQVEDAPKGKLFAKRYVVSGKVQKVGYRNWIRKQANQQNLHGYTRNLKNGKVVVVVASEDENKVNDFIKYCKKGPEKAFVEEVKAFDWNSQIKAGFEIRKTK